MSEKDEDEDLRNVPPHFKSYTVQDRHSFYKKAKCILDIYDDGVYEGSAKVKEVNIAPNGETPKLAFISVDLTIEERQQLVLLIKEYQDCFACSYDDMKGIPPEVVHHNK